MTTADAAARLRLSERHTRWLCIRGAFPSAVKRGRDWWIDDDDVLREAARRAARQQTAQRRR